MRACGDGCEVLQLGITRDACECDTALGVNRLDFWGVSVLPY